MGASMINVTSVEGILNKLLEINEVDGRNWHIDSSVKRMKKNGSQLFWESALTDLLKKVQSIKPLNTEKESLIKLLLQKIAK